MVVGVTAVLSAIVAFLMKRHRDEPDVERLLRVKREAAQLEKRVRLKERVVAAAQRDREGQGQRAAADIARRQNHGKALHERESAEIKVILDKRDRLLTNLAERRKRCDLEEAQAIDQVRKSSKLPALDREISRFEAGQVNEVQKALKLLQDQHVLAYLSQSSIMSADLRGIGPKLKQRLIQKGVRTAAEIKPSYGVWSVEGIGPTKNAVLMHWRQDREQAAARAMPQRLPPGSEAQIRSRFAPQIERLQQEKVPEDARVKAEASVIRQRYAGLRTQVEKDAVGVQPGIDVETRATRVRYAREQSAITEEVCRLEGVMAQQILEADAHIRRQAQDLADLRFKRESKGREVRALRSVAFGSYLRRILFWAS
jgi:hypothetical protein